MPIGRSFVLVTLFATLLGACGRSEKPSFGADDLRPILPQPDEAPRGTRASTLGGRSDLDAFARDAAERDALAADGFVSGYVVYFPPDSYFRHEPHADTDVAYQAIAGVFESADGAASSLRRYVGDLRTRQMTGAADISTGGLGDEAFGLAGGAASDGSFLRVYAWRISNLILVLVASGPADERTVLGLARAMDARARSL
jgi:hypothetical protein